MKSSINKNAWCSSAGALLLTLPPETVHPSKHFDPLTSLRLQLMDFNLRDTQTNVIYKSYKPLFALFINGFLLWSCEVLGLILITSLKHLKSNSKNTCRSSDLLTIHKGIPSQPDELLVRPRLTVSGSGRLGSFSMMMFLASSRFFSLLSLSPAYSVNIEADV